MAEPEPRAYTAEEMRTKFLTHVRDIVRRHPNDSGLVAFSILCLIDGVSSLPTFDLVARPHSTDRAFDINRGENWVEPGQIINDCPEYLHDLLDQGPQ
ncbi:MAG: hypothetical protein GY929_20300 [Actinomycetia bacterium]|nr:hypothetical protein [Actinomycetes bacterium]